MNILIADNNKIARMGLSILVNSQLPNAVICEVDNMVDVLNVLKQKEIAMLLMDLKMPDTNSIGFLEMVIGIYPKLKILVVSQNPERIFAMRCLKAGAYGYIEICCDPTNLKKAIVQVAKGKKYVSEGVLEQMAESTKGKVSDPFAVLTKKEFLIANYLINDITNEEICDTLNTQSHTMETFIKRILEKMNVKSITELSQFAAQYDFC